LATFADQRVAEVVRGVLTWPTVTLTTFATLADACIANAVAAMACFAAVTQAEATIEWAGVAGLSDRLIADIIAAGIAFAAPTVERASEAGFGVGWIADTVSALV
jgi:hypothetical protein